MRRASPGGGSNFTLYLPLAHGRPAGAEGGLRLPEQQAVPLDDLGSPLPDGAGPRLGGHRGRAEPAGRLGGRPGAQLDGQPDGQPDGHGTEETFEPPAVVSGPPVAPALLDAGEVDDDRADLQPSDRVLLVASEDTALAQMSVRQGRERGFKVIAVDRADTAVAVAKEIGPDAVIVGMDAVTAEGTPVLEALKRSPDTRHIPVHVVDSVALSGVGADGGGDGGGAERRHHAMQAGALAVLRSPVTAEGWPRRWRRWRRSSRGGSAGYSSSRTTTPSGQPSPSWSAAARTSRSPGSARRTRRWRRSRRRASTAWCSTSSCPAPAASRCSSS
jgi:hypothetical protein